MPTARALVQLIHENIMRFPGDTFEYAGKLKGEAIEGMEWVNKKTDAAFEDTKAKALAELQKIHDDAVVYLEDVRGQLEADPSRGDLITQVLDAETKVQDTAKAVADATPTSDLV